MILIIFYLAVLVVAVVLVKYLLDYAKVPQPVNWIILLLVILAGLTAVYYGAPPARF